MNGGKRDFGRVRTEMLRNRLLDVGHALEETRECLREYRKAIRTARKNGDETDWHRKVCRRLSRDEKRMRRTTKAAAAQAEIAEIVEDEMAAIFGAGTAEKK